MTNEREAKYYDRLEDGAVLCRLCPRRCKLKPGATGFCRTRRNVDGRLIYLLYGACSSIALDPVEKKPLYHFHPGSTILSIGSVGCNLACDFCQNWEIAQSTVPTTAVEPREIVELAVERQNTEHCIGVAYTYNEPLVEFEFVLDTARLVREAGMKNVLVTNGEIEPEPLEELLECVDAFNIDIKGFTEKFYLECCHGPLAPVLRTADRAAKSSHVEITNLIIPGENDSEAELQALVDWAASVSPELPIHFSAYHPDYHFQAPATPAATLQRAYDLAREQLKFVYVGNLHLAGTTDTVCPQCGRTLIVRRGMTGTVTGLDERGRCAACGSGANVRL